MKRRVAIVAIFLTLGALVNVAVAWACALTIPGLTTSRSALKVHDKVRGGNPYWMDVHIDEGFGFHRHMRGRKIRDVLPEDAGRDSIIVQWRYNHPAQSLPMKIASWSDLPVFEVDDRIIAVETECAAGWPMFALRLRAEEPGASWRLAGAWHCGVLPFSGRHLNGRVEHVPLIPIVPGFIINSIFYAVLFWLGFAGSFAIRRALRRKRRLCEKCAYPVGVSPVCTECGTVLQELQKTEPRPSGSAMSAR